MLFEHFQRQSGRPAASISTGEERRGAVSDENIQNMPCCRLAVETMVCPLYIIGMLWWDCKKTPFTFAGLFHN
jgi:hypothetical protein